MQKLYVIKGLYNNKIVYYVSTELKTSFSLPLRTFAYNIKDATTYNNLDMAISDCKDLRNHFLRFILYVLCVIQNIQSHLLYLDLIILQKFVLLAE